MLLPDLIALITAINATPTSEKIASHIDDKPIIDRTITISFINRENIIFSFTITSVFLLIFIALEIFDGLSETTTVEYVKE